SRSTPSSPRRPCTSRSLLAATSPERDDAREAPARGRPRLVAQREQWMSALGESPRRSSWTEHMGSTSRQKMSALGAWPARRSASAQLGSRRLSSQKMSALAEWPISRSVERHDGAGGGVTTTGGRTITGGGVTITGGGLTTTAPRARVKPLL